MTQIQAASVSAIPQQANRESRTPTGVASSEMDQIELQLTEKLDKSTETGDRDAQEQYQRPNQSSNKPTDPGTTASQPANIEVNSIWNLSVADDQPPPDLDIVG